MPRYTRRALLKAGLAASAGAMASGNPATSALAAPEAGKGQAEAGPKVAIVQPRNADRVVQFAAQELARYLNEMGAGQVSLNADGAAHRIVVGELSAEELGAETAALRGEVQSLAGDGFVIRSLGPNVAILGKGSRGVLYGCYAFLEAQGARWFAPGRQYEVVPRHGVDWNVRLDVKESPAFPARILFYWPNNFTRVVEWIDFCAKARINRLMFHSTWPARDWYLTQRDALLPELKKRGMEIEVGGHFLSTFLPRGLFVEHPEWFRMNEQGKRVNDFNLNPFNPEALEYLSTGAAAWVEQMPEASMVHVWADDIDGGGWSHEPGKASYMPSDQSLLAANAVVRRVRKKLPQAKLAYLAYHDTVSPPKAVKPEPGLVYLYAPRERCYAHALSDPDCALNRKYALALEEGLPAFGGERAEVFEYYTDQILYESMTNPPLTEVMSADLKYYRKLGIPAAGALMTQTGNFVTPLANMFLYPQALWNPERDLSRSLREYAALYFGDAELAGYFESLRRGMEDVLKICRYEHPGDPWDGMRVDREPDEALAFHVAGLEAGITGPLAAASEALKRALATAKAPQYAERLRGEQAATGFTQLQARVFYHALKGELRYRAWKQRQEAEAGLAALTELGLARWAVRARDRFAATAGMKASPMMPGVGALEDRAKELFGAIASTPAQVAGVNVFGFALDRLDEQLLDGVTGYVAAGPTGSQAVLWTDVTAARIALRAGADGLVWMDEFGTPASTMDCSQAPVVVAGKGMAADKLYAALLRGQLEMHGAT